MHLSQPKVWSPGIFDLPAHKRCILSKKCFLCFSRTRNRAVCHCIKKKIGPNTSVERHRRKCFQPCTLQLIQSWEREMLSIMICSRQRQQLSCFRKGTYHRSSSQKPYRSSENIWCYKQNKSLKSLPDLYVKWRQNIRLHPWEVYKKAT